MKLDFDKTVREKARAKINASLDVLGLMPDGYHELDTVMVSLSLCDDVCVTLRRGDSIDISVSVPGFSELVPQNEQNTASKAAMRFFERLGITGVSAEIEIKKRIPVGAGLGGGSADAAAVLRALNLLCGNAFSIGKLRQTGLHVGADVPFCITGGTVRAGGRGELLTTLPDFPDCYITLVKPTFSNSTAELYAKIDDVELNERPDTNALVAAIVASDLKTTAAQCHNVFEQALSPEQLATVAKIKNTLRSCGALNSAMTGTGSVVFGIFGDITAAERAKAVLSREFEAFICKPEV